MTWHKKVLVKLPVNSTAGIFNKVVKSGQHKPRRVMSNDLCSNSDAAEFTCRAAVVLA